MKKLLGLVISITTFTNVSYASFPILVEPERSPWYTVGQTFGVILVVAVGGFVLYLIYKLFRYFLRVFLEKRGFLVSSLSFISMAVIGIPILTVIFIILGYAISNIS
tara:strand:- start:147 stop:467 length:321 start_codon:yes stop_codon:yes gene_type:complete